MGVDVIWALMMCTLFFSPSIFLRLVPAKSRFQLGRYRELATWSRAARY